MTLFGFALNVSARLLVPLRYLNTLFAAVMCCFVGFEQYFANMLVIVAISGLVDMDSQFSDPINDWYCCVS